MLEYVYALHDFTPENPDEVPFKAGEEIEVIEKDDMYQDGWWQGRNKAGQVGLFPQSYTSSRPPASSGIELLPPVTFPDAVPAALQPLEEEVEAILVQEASPTDERERTLSQGERTMQATLTDVQRAIEQLGRADDGARSFSFASSHGDTDRSEPETEGEGGDSDEEGGTNWHRDARQRLALRAQQHNEARERESGVPLTPLRLTAPPIDVELSDESEDEGEDTTQHGQRRRSGHTAQYPHIPEEEEEAAVLTRSPPMTLVMPTPDLPIIPSLPSAAMVNAGTAMQTPSLSVESADGHIEPSEDFIVPSPSRTDENQDEGLPTATADHFTLPEAVKPPVVHQILSPPPPESLESEPPTQDRVPSPPPSLPPVTIVTSVISPKPVIAVPTSQELRIPGGLNPISPISPEHEQQITPIPMPLPVTAPLAPPAPPAVRTMPIALKVDGTIPFLARSTSPGRNSLPSSAGPLPSPSVSSIGSIGFSSSAGIQQTLTPATTVNLSAKGSAFSQAQQELSPIGGQDGGRGFRTHPSDWTVEEVVEWLRSKGFDQEVCDKFTEQEVAGDALLELDIEVLKKEFEIAAYGKRFRIINAITELRRPPSFTDEHPMQTLMASRSQSLNYGHSHTSSIQSSAQQSYNNSPLGYLGPSFSPTPSHRGIPTAALNSAGSGSFMGPESPVYVATPETMTSVGRGAWNHNEQTSVSFPSAVSSEASLGTTRVEASPSTTIQPLAHLSQGSVGLGLGFPSNGSMSSRPDSPSTANGKTKSRPANLVLSPSDSSLKATAVGDDASAFVERAALSDSEVTHHTDAKPSRRRLFGLPESSSFRDRSSSIKDSSSRHSKEGSPATASEGAHGDQTESAPVRRRSKRNSDDRKPSDRLSLFGNTISGTLAKARKPVPRLSSSTAEKIEKTEKIEKVDKPDKHEHDWSALTSFARIRHSHSDKKASGRPSTSDGVALRGAYEKLSDLSPEKVQLKEKDHKDISAKEKRDSGIKDKEKRDSAVLRKRTSSTSDIVARSPALAAQAAGGIALKPGKSIQEQIGSPDHSGWMRKKSERYNSWKSRYFVLKGPHLYCLKSNDKSETKIKGYINILGYRVVADEKIDPGRYGFKIVHDSDKPHYFSHDEQMVIREWMKALMKSTISRDFTNPVVSSSNIPTIPLTVAQAMTPSPRPPSPTARAATQRAHRRDNPNQLSSRDAQVLLMALPSKDKALNGAQSPERPRAESFYSTDSAVTTSAPNASKKSPISPKMPPPRPSREIRRTFSNKTVEQEVVVDESLIEWANSHLPESLQITDPSGILCNGLALLRLAEDIKGMPSSPPVPDSAFPNSPTDERLDGLFRLFDFLLDNDVKMGNVSINDIRQGKREKIAQLLQALRMWEDKRRAIALSLSMGSAGTQTFMAGPVAYFQ